MGGVEKELVGNLKVKIGLKVEPSEEFCNVASALGFTRVVYCCDCRYYGTSDCPIKDDVKYISFCSRGQEKEK